MLLHNLEIYEVIVMPSGTVDGKNPAPVEVGRFSHYLRRVLYIPGGCLGFLPSTVLSLT